MERRPVAVAVAVDAVPLTVSPASLQTIADGMDCPVSGLSVRNPKALATVTNVVANTSNASLQTPPPVTKTKKFVIETPPDSLLSPPISNALQTKHLNGLLMSPSDSSPSQVPKTTAPPSASLLVSPPAKVPTQSQLVNVAVRAAQNSENNWLPRSVSDASLIFSLNRSTSFANPNNGFSEFFNLDGDGDDADQSNLGDTESEEDDEELICGERLHKMNLLEEAEELVAESPEIKTPKPNTIISKLANSPLAFLSPRRTAPKSGSRLVPCSLASTLSPSTSSRLAFPASPPPCLLPTPSIAAAHTAAAAGYLSPLAIPSFTISAEDKDDEMALEQHDQQLQALANAASPAQNAVSFASTCFSEHDAASSPLRSLRSPSRLSVSEYKPSPLAQRDLPAPTKEDPEPPQETQTTSTSKNGDDEEGIFGDDVPLDSFGFYEKTPRSNEENQELMNDPDQRRPGQQLNSPLLLEYEQLQTETWLRHLHNCPFPATSGWAKDEETRSTIDELLEDLALPDREEGPSTIKVIDSSNISRRIWRKTEARRLKSLVQNGVPMAFRGRVWKMLATSSCANEAALACFDIASSTDPKVKLSKLMPSLPWNGDSVEYHLMVQRCILEAHDQNSPAAQLYERLASLGPNSHTEQILLDIDRTLVGHHFFSRKDGRGQMQLRRILQAYSHFNPTIGYCQGMSYPTAMLMLMPNICSFHPQVSDLCMCDPCCCVGVDRCERSNVQEDDRKSRSDGRPCAKCGASCPRRGNMRTTYNDDERAKEDLVSPAEVFWMMVWMFDDSRTGQYYAQSMRGIIRDAAIFDQLLQLHLPSLHQHLEANSLHPLMYVTSWFMTFFTCLPSWKTVLRFMDMFFLEGTTAIFRFSLAIMSRCQKDLMQLDSLDQLLPFLQRVPLRLCRAFDLVPLACSIPIEDLLNKSRLAMERAQNNQAQPQSRTPNRLPSQSGGSLMSPRTSIQVKKEQQQGLLSKFWSSIATPLRSQKASDTPQSSRVKATSLVSPSPSAVTKSATSVTPRVSNPIDDVGLISPTNHHRSRIAMKSQRRAALHDSLSILSASLQQPSSEDDPQIQKADENAAPFV